MMNGLTVLTSVWLTEPGEPVTVRRSWRERWCGYPWRPWCATRTIIPQVPSKRAVYLNRNTIVVHPAMLDQLRQLGGSDG